MTKFRAALAVVLSLALAGCTGSPSADVLKSLAGDPNSICLTVTSPWGGMSLDRNHGCGAAGAPVVVVTPGGTAAAHVDVIHP